MTRHRIRLFFAISIGVVVISFIIISITIFIMLCNLHQSAETSYQMNNALINLESINHYYESIKPINIKSMVNKEMPTFEVGSEVYIGILEIPSQGIKLPIIQDCTYKNLEIAPCKFIGNVYQNNMIIAAHNYTTHFNCLEKLVIGDEVLFTDIDGNLFRYKVSKNETIDGKDSQTMYAGNWDLTLFTCNISGSKRILIRCNLI